MQKENYNDWLIGFQNKIFKFLVKMSDNNYSYFKYSYSGDLFNFAKKWGLGQRVFAVKLLFMLNQLKNLNSLERNNIIRSIKSFERSNSYIYDTLVSKITLKNRLMDFVRHPHLEYLFNEETKRAETRQALASLLCLEAKPEKPFLHIPYTINEVNDYLGKLDWNNPWHAGSHFSHLLFFYNSNRVLFGYKEKLTEELKQYAIKWVNRLQSENDGTWYKGVVPLNIKINGAMKILTGLAASNYFSINYVQRLMDTCLEGINDSHACDNFNIVYVLYFCSQITDYKRDDINNFFRARLEIYREYFYPELGGFSFQKNKANDTYYGATITKGLNEPDIHGTMMFTWGISLISQVIDLGFKLKIPIT